MKNPIPIRLSLWNRKENPFEAAKEWSEWNTWILKQDRKQICIVDSDGAGIYLEIANMDWMSLLHLKFPNLYFIIDYD